MKRFGTLALNGIKLHAYHGVKPEEKSLGQKYEVSLSLTFPFPGEDCIKRTVDYREIVEFVEKFFVNNRFNLLEFAARSLAEKLLQSYPQVNRICVKITKLSPPLPQHVESVEAYYEIER